MFVCREMYSKTNPSISYFLKGTLRGAEPGSPSWLRYRCLSESDISLPSNKVNDDWRHNLPVLEYFLCMFFNSGFGVVVTGTARDDKTWQLSCLVDTGFLSIFNPPSIQKLPPPVTNPQFPVNLGRPPPPNTILRHLTLPSHSNFSSVMPKSPHESRVAGGVQTGPRKGGWGGGDGGGVKVRLRWSWRREVNRDGGLER